ncbi:MAG TPA: hypothetical protein VEY12_11975 [Thermoplasmata archaeon]|nr:hypothetical protein [Thermoplasmata archaeon]
MPGPANSAATMDGMASGPDVTDPSGATTCAPSNHVAAGTAASKRSAS